jgi:hypothetical protein
MGGRRATRRREGGKRERGKGKRAAGGREGLLLTIVLVLCWYQARIEKKKKKRATHLGYTLTLTLYGDY